MNKNSWQDLHQIMPTFFQMAAFYLARRRSFKLLREYHHFEKMSVSELNQLKLQKLKELIKRTEKNNTFYRNLWKENAVNTEIHSIADLDRFPTVTKEMLRNAAHKNELISKDLHNSRNNYIDSTTGSSGEPFQVIIDRECYYSRVASMLYLRGWYGQKTGDLVVKLWRGPLNRTTSQQLKEWVLARYTISIYDPSAPVTTHMNTRRIERIIQELNKIRPQFIDGFVSALAIIAQHILEYKVQLNFCPKAVITGAEALTDTDRQLIEKAFQAPVFNRYGGTEFGVIGHECAEQAKTDHFLHTQDYRGHVEVIENEIVFTDFENVAMPLIRYRTGDSGILLNSNRCACGRPFGLIKELTGRINDLFVLRDGSKVSSHLWHHYVKKCLGIKNYQLIQNTHTSFTCKFVLAPDTDLRELKKVKALIQGALPGCTVNWEIVSEISAGPGGKLRQNISLLNFPTQN